MTAHFLKLIRFVHYPTRSVASYFSSFRPIVSVRLLSPVICKAALKFGSEAWVLKKREEQRLEAAQMKFLRHLLGITKLDFKKPMY